MTTNNNEIVQKNRHLYDGLWGGAWLLEAQHFNTWPLVEGLLKKHQRRVEIAPGLRPRLPTQGTSFVDISQAALGILKQHGGHTTKASICDLPFSSKSFDLVCALDIVEHVEDDEGAFSELSRIITEGGTLLLSTPLHQQWWTQFDEFVGHYRRYEPSRLKELLHKYGFEVEQSAVFGMKPKSSKLTDLGMWFLKHNPTRAMWWYNRVFPHIARRQKPLQLSEGLPAMDEIGEIFMVCKRIKQTPEANT